jgi:hypothetical protein
LKGRSPREATVSSTREFGGTFRFMQDLQCSTRPATASGRIKGNRLQIDIRSGFSRITGSLVKGGS